MDRAQAERSVLQRGWLADQQPDFQSAILRNSRLLSFPEREFMFHAGDDAGGIYGVVTGGIGVHLPLRTGETRLVHIVRCDTWFGYSPFIRGGARRMTFSVMEPSTVLHVPIARLQEIAAMSPRHQRSVALLAEYGMDVAVHTIDTLLIGNSERRIAATLLRVSERPDRESADICTQVRLSQTQLGEMANAERQVVNRALKKMVSRGWLDVNYGRIDILDRPALEAFVWGD